MKKPVMFYLPEEEKERLVKSAQFQGRTISEVMRRAIAAWIAKDRPPVEKEQRAE